MFKFMQGEKTLIVRSIKFSERERESERPGVWAETDQRGMIQVHAGSQTLVLPLQEVFGAPDPNGAVVGARRQVFPVAAEIEACHVPTVALKSTRTQIHTWTGLTLEKLHKLPKTIKTNDSGPLKTH